jgi:hypothetical protein
MEEDSRWLGWPLDHSPLYEQFPVDIDASDRIGASSEFERTAPFRSIHHAVSDTASR